MIRLLLVDDERIIREGIAKMMPCEKLGIEITAACPNALIALDSMMDTMPDILLTDVKMPGVDGLLLIERALTLRPDLLCVILSGYDEFSFARKAMSLGVKEYLLKPCDAVELEETLARVCGEIRERRQRATHEFGNRERRMREMVGRLEELLNHAELTEAMLRGVLGAEEDASIVRDALIYLFSHHPGISPEWGMDEINAIYEPGDERLYGQVIESLMKVRTASREDCGFVEKMKIYMLAHYSDPELSLQYLADRVVHMNADYIGKEFARAEGQKVSGYLTQIRMERAKKLMGSGESMIYEIAEQVGLGHNPQYFSQLFRKATGVSPKEYVQEMRDDLQ